MVQRTVALVYLGRCKVFGMAGKEGARWRLLRDDVRSKQGAHGPIRNSGVIPKTEETC